MSQTHNLIALGILNAWLLNTLNVTKCIAEILHLVFKRAYTNNRKLYMDY
jgi:hypothetical protein